MIVGHYGAALIPYGRRVALPLWALLLCSNLSDFLWLLLALVGVERPTPYSMFEASFSNIHVTMPFSHDLLPVLSLSFFVFIVVWLIKQDKLAALWCAGLVIFHLLCDLMSGFEHHVGDEASPQIGLNLYGHAPELALLIEALFGGACVYWYSQALKRRGSPLSQSKLKKLYWVFVGGALVWLPIARVPIMGILHLVTRK